MFPCLILLALNQYKRTEEMHHFSLKSPGAALELEPLGLTSIFNRRDTRLFEKTHYSTHEFCLRALFTRVRLRPVTSHNHY